MPIPDTFRVDLRRVPDGPRNAFHVTVHRREPGWILQSPAGYLEPGVLRSQRPDVDAWLRESCGRWLTEVDVDTGQWRFVDEDAIGAFLAFVGRPSPERTEAELEVEAERRRANAGRREARERRAAELAKIPWPSSGPRRVTPARSLEVHRGLSESYGLSALHLAGPGHVVMGGGRGRIVRTTDGGERWTELRIDSPHGIRAFWGPADDLHVVGQSGAARSTDGGASWETTLSFERGAVGRVDGTGRGRRFALDGGWLLEGTRASGGWRERGPVVEHGNFMESGLLALPRSLLACDVGGRIIRSTDEGRSFEEVATRSNEKEAFGGMAAAKGVVIVIGKGGPRRGRPRILRSVDEGRSFHEADVPDVGVPDCRLLDVWGGSASDWWACGQDGVLLHSRDGGATWAQAPLETDEDLRCVRGLPGGEMWLLGEETIWKSETAPVEASPTIAGLWSA